MSRVRGNSSGSITSYKTNKGKRKYRIRVTADSYFDENSGKFKYASKSLGSYDTRAEAEAVLAEYNASPYDLTTKITTVGDLYNAWSVEYFERIAPSAKRTVEAAWAYCNDIAKLPLKKLGSKHIEQVMKNGTREIIRGSSKEVRKASIYTQMRIKSMFNLMLDYIPEFNNLTYKDELELDRLGEEKMVLFLNIPLADRTYSWITAMLFSITFAKRGTVRGACEL